MHKALIHYYVDMGHIRTQKKHRNLKATPELFLQGWTNRIFCLAALFRPFLTEKGQEEAHKSEVGKVT